MTQPSHIFETGGSDELVVLPAVDHSVVVVRLRCIHEDPSGTADCCDQNPDDGGERRQDGRGNACIRCQHGAEDDHQGEEGEHLHFLSFSFGWNLEVVL